MNQDKCSNCNLLTGSSNGRDYYKVNFKVYCGWECVNEDINNKEVKPDNKTNKNKKKTKKSPKSKKR